VDDALLAFTVDYDDLQQAPGAVRADDEDRVVVPLDPAIGTRTACRMSASATPCFRALSAISTKHMLLTSSELWKTYVSGRRVLARVVVDTSAAEVVSHRRRSEVAYLSVA